MFVRKAVTYPSEKPFRRYTLGRLLALPDTLNEAGKTYQEQTI